MFELCKFLSIWMCVCVCEWVYVHVCVSEKKDSETRTVKDMIFLTVFDLRKVFGAHYRSWGHGSRSNEWTCGSKRRTYETKGPSMGDLGADSKRRVGLFLPIVLSGIYGPRQWPGKLQILVEMGEWWWPSEDWCFSKSISICGSNTSLRRELIFQEQAEAKYHDFPKLHTK